MADDNHDISNTIHNFLRKFKPQVEIFGSSKSNPIKTDDTGKLMIDGKFDIDADKSSLAETGRLFSISQLINNRYSDTICYQISNPMNSGRTIKIQEIWVTIYYIEVLRYGGPLFIKFYKNSNIDQNLFTEINGGYNWNFGSSDDHAAKFYSCLNPSLVDPVNCFSSSQVINGFHQKIYINGDIILPSNATQDEHLQIVIAHYLQGLDRDSITVGSSFTIIWSEE